MHLFSLKSVSSKILFSFMLAKHFCKMPSSWIWRTDFLLTGKMHSKAFSYQDKGHPVGGSCYLHISDTASAAVPPHQPNLYPVRNMGDILGRSTSGGTHTQDICQGWGKEVQRRGGESICHWSGIHQGPELCLNYAWNDGDWRERERNDLNISLCGTGEHIQVAKF